MSPEKDESKGKPEGDFGWEAEPVMGDFEEIEDKENEEGLNELYKELGRIALEDDEEFEEKEEEESETGRVTEATQEALVQEEMGLGATERGLEESEDNGLEMEADEKKEGKEAFLEGLDELNRETEQIVKEANKAVEEAKWMLELDKLNRETEKVLEEAEKALTEAERVIRGLEGEKEGQSERRATFERVLIEASKRVKEAKEEWEEWKERACGEIDKLTEAAETRRFGDEETELRIRRLEECVANAGGVIYKNERANSEFEEAMIFGMSRQVVSEEEKNELKRLAQKLAEELAEMKTGAMRVEETYEGYKREFYIRKQNEEELMAMLNRINRNLY